MIDANIIIAGDINQLNIRDLISQHNLVQMVKKPTRGDRILDVFLTNKTHLWKPAPIVFKIHQYLKSIKVMATPVKQLTHPCVVLFLALTLANQ